MRFGVFVPQGWRMDLVGIEAARHWEVMNGLAQRIDGDPAWDSLWVYDHFHTVPRPSEEATHEAWSLMAAYAASTRRVRIGQMCAHRDRPGIGIEHRIDGPDRAAERLVGIGGRTCLDRQRRRRTRDRRPPGCRSHSAG